MLHAMQCRRDEEGALYWDLPLSGGASEVGCLVHKGEQKAAGEGRGAGTAAGVRRYVGTTAECVYRGKKVCLGSVVPSPVMTPCAATRRASKRID